MRKPNSQSIDPEELERVIDRLVEERVQQALAKERHAEPPVEPIPAQNPDLYYTPPADPDLERELLAVLDECDGNVSRAADLALRQLRSTQPRQPLARLLDKWRRNPKTGVVWDWAANGFVESSFLVVYLEKLARRRESEKTGASFSSVPTPEQSRDQLWHLRRAFGLLPFVRQEFK